MWDNPDITSGLSLDMVLIQFEDQPTPAAVPYSILGLLPLIVGPRAIIWNSFPRSHLACDFMSHCSDQYTAASDPISL